MSKKIKIIFKEVEADKKLAEQQIADAFDMLFAEVVKEINKNKVTKQQARANYYIDVL